MERCFADANDNGSCRFNDRYSHCPLWGHLVASVQPPPEYAIRQPDPIADSPGDPSSAGRSGDIRDGVADITVLSDAFRWFRARARLDVLTRLRPDRHQQVRSEA